MDSALIMLGHSTGALERGILAVGLVFVVIGIGMYLYEAPQTICYGTFCTDTGVSVYPYRNLGLGIGGLGAVIAIIGAFGPEQTNQPKPLA